MPELIAITVSLLSLFISVVGYITSKNHHGDSLTSDLITENWQQFLSLHDVSATFPYHCYLFEVGEEYAGAVTRVRAAIMALPESERAAFVGRARLEERALVRRILSMFEHALYQANHAAKHDDTYRTQFLKDVLHYYTDRALNNPRVSWYWIESGGNQRIHMEESTRKYCETLVKFSHADGTDPFHDLDNQLNTKI